ncbi:MAG: conserved rane protein of unknown function [Alphaproteobacteria bacterium]|nr:conserved rane protein of unknown function [Alphaproteobacteria bacterium]
MILAYWHWVIFGLAMMAAELMVPGAFFLWVGIAALMLGVTTFIFPFMAVPGQLVLFGVLAPLAAIIGRKVMRNLPGSAEPSLLNRRGQQLAGETITLDVPIIKKLFVFLFSLLQEAKIFALSGRKPWIRQGCKHYGVCSFIKRICKQTTR